MKDYYNKYKELKKNPRYNALFKLIRWGLFFSILFILVIATSNLNNVPSEDTSGKSILTLKNELINSNIKLKYTNEFQTIEGTVIDNIFEGTLEENGVLKKIYIDDLVYEVSGDDKLLIEDISPDFILPLNVLNLLKETIPQINLETDKKIYTYQIEDAKIMLEADENQINEIIIINDQIHNLYIQIIT